MDSFLSPRRAGLAIGLLLFGAGNASAYITVGPGCQFTDLQDAINRSSTTTGTFEYHVRAGYVGGPISYNNKSIWIFGGYPSCDAAEPIPFNGQNFGDLSTIDGSRSSGHAAIEVSGSSRLALHNFNLHNANHGGANGGGISYNGSGAHAFLALQSTNINHNTAERGAGVFFRSTAADSVMSIEHHTWIEFNTATISGGGIRLEGNVRLTANGNPASISNNTANTSSSDGAGGGIQLRDDTRADIGSPGNGGFAFIDANHARVGGGVSLDNNAILNLYSTLPGQHARIENNTADFGGGVYVHPDGGSPTMCMVGGGINFNQTSASGNGTAIQVDSGSSHVSSGDNVLACDVNGLPNFVPCAQGQPCNTIDNNQGSHHGSAMVNVDGGSDGFVYLGNIAMRSNFGGHLIYTSSSQTRQIDNCVATGNSVADSLITSEGSTLNVVRCSIAGNHMEGDIQVLRPLAGGVLGVYSSILWEPGHPSLSASGHILQNVIAPDSGGWNRNDFVQYFNVSAADPLFVNTNAGDLHLQDASPAIDAAPTGLQLSVDLDQNPRGIDVVQGPGSPNLGVYDLGAYEVQHTSVGVPVTFPPDENFDELGPVNTLPANWQTASTTEGWAWMLANTSADTGPLAAFGPDARVSNDSTLTTTPFHVVRNAQLSFRHRVSLENAADAGAYDGARLEIRIGSDPAFRDIVDAGGTIVEGNYDHVLVTGVGNPLQGAAVWSGNHVGFESVLVVLPPAANGQDCALRWRIATDQNNGLGGYWLDSIHIEPDGGGPDDEIFTDGFEPFTS